MPEASPFRPLGCEDDPVLPTTLLLDLDGVLRLWPKERSVLEQDHNLPVGSIWSTAFEPALLERVITGQIMDSEWRREVGNRLMAAYPSSRAEEAVTAWSLSSGKVHDEVLRLVNRAREHCRVGLVTNGTDRLLHDLEELGLTEHLDFVVNSSDVGFAKPDLRIFRRALAMAGAQPVEAVFIDDTPSNVSAAGVLGIRTHHFVSVAGLRTFLQSVGLVTNAI
jgi:putative hydrolase of the HAD superfamily